MFITRIALCKTKCRIEKKSLRNLHNAKRGPVTNKTKKKTATKKMTEKMV